MTFRNKLRWAYLAPSALALVAAFAPSAMAVELKDAVQAAVSSNPEIQTAVQDKQAIEFERKQAQGLYLPRADLEASAGIERLDNPTRRILGIDNRTLKPVEVGLTASETLFDSGYRRSELDRQAARSDGAATRVSERSEFIALDVVKEYLNFLLEQRLVAIGQDNVAFHSAMVSDLRQGVQQGSISVADLQQAEERMHASRARVTEAQEDLLDSMIGFSARTGVTLDSATLPPPITAQLPANQTDAVGLARTNNPRVKIAQADVDAALALIRQAKSALGPKVSLEFTGRAGNDIDGFENQTTDVLGRVVMRWNVFSGGINQANVQEQVRRASEERYRLLQVMREVDTDVQQAWNRREQQAVLLGQVETQAKVSDDLVNSYREQFRVGRRSLLDVLDAQNTRYNAQVQRETARFAELFAEYKVLAATGQLLDVLGVSRPSDAKADARDRFGVAATPPAETMSRHHVD
ncbi:TolC family protein [Caulobacter sp. KR2-114]|uniref:TolC family protein n=1 Tax=Caulobacter sp. KR2-114 TaxID=3400912 RepID=UPI003BFFA11C